tara:strand:- start:4737 stop:5882 length:1146 start_codon:yes stop_codon:yes gene_type:complete
MNLTNKSIKVIKNLQLENGGILATSKNGAYPYVYVRDGVIMTKALNRMGLSKKSEKFYYFINKFSKVDNYKEIFHRYNANGLPCVTRKNENDNEGILLHGIYDTYLHTKKESFLKYMWPLIKEVVKLIYSYSRNGLVKTERSIHEFYRLEHGYEIWTNSVCCRGLYDASKIADILGHKDKSKEWEKKAKQIEENIHKKLFNKKLGIFIKNKRFPETPDISQLAPFYFKIVNSKVILRKTLNYLQKHIWNNSIGGFRRFEKFEVCKDWHWYTGGSGSWIFFTCWGAKFYNQIGDKKKARECLSFVNRVAAKSGGLLPEHISTKEEYYLWKKKEIEFNRRIINETKKAEKFIKKFKDKKMIYWANPLGWSHAEYILIKKDWKK